MNNNDRSKFLISAPKACEEIEIVVKLIDSQPKVQIEHSENLRAPHPLNQAEKSIIEIIKRAINGEYALPGSFDIKARSSHRQVPKAQVLRILKSNTRLLRLFSENEDKQEGAEKAKRVITNLVSRNLLTEQELTIGRSTKLCIGLV